MKHAVARRIVSTLVLCVAAIAAAGCGGTGLCVSTGGSPEECHEGWDESECQDWNSRQVNGATWTFYGSGTCAEQGFSAKCPDGTYVHDASSC